jgi:hypothetical protein
MGRLALSHDGLWVFANRIFANWIFANGVLADWRRRHRGGSLRGRSAAAASLSMATSPAVTIMIVFMMLIPLCCSSGTGRPNDAPIPLRLCETPASTIPPSGSIARGNGSRLFVALALDWFKCDFGRIGKDAD